MTLLGLVGWIAIRPGAFLSALVAHTRARSPTQIAAAVGVLELHLVVDVVIVLFLFVLPMMIWLLVSARVALC